MAQFYPMELVSLKVSPAEYALYHLLREQLNDQYTVFHSVAWQSIGKNGRPQEGEADFLIAHPRDGLLLLEVKGGVIQHDGRADKWTSVSAGQKQYPIKDPFLQARTAKYRLLDLLGRIMPEINQLAIGHAVAFPDVLVEAEWLGSDKPRAIVLDMTETADLQGWVQRCMGYWRGEISTTTMMAHRRAIRTLTQLLGQTRELRPAMWGEVVREQAEMIQLTEEQYSLLDLLNRQHRVAISGCAGSGKTMLAVEKATRLARQGFKVLLTCYNKNLASFLQRQVGKVPNLTISHFHRLCFDLARCANLLPIQTQDKTAFYDYLLPEAAMEAVERLNGQFDAIVVDEGQDFHEAWWLPLQGFLRHPDEGILYIFYDNNQRIYQQSKSAESHFPVDTPPFTLTINCRNTRAIHKQVTRFYNAELPTLARGPVGRPIDVKQYKSAEQFHAALSDTLTYLTKEEKVPPQEITILTPLSHKLSQLWASSGFRGFRFSDEWSAEPNTIHCNTIHAFKGLESSVVILAETDQWRGSNKEIDPLLYVACSRATNHLIVMLPETAPSSLQHRFS